MGVVGLQLKSRRKFRSMLLLRKVEYMIVVVSAESAITMVEKQLCAAQRLYGNIVKLKPHPQNPRSLEGNIIVFRHDGPESASSITSLPCMDVLHSVKVLFLGTNDQFEMARRNAVV